MIKRFIVLPSQKVVTALDRTWHPEHFFCAQCGAFFGPEGEETLTEGSSGCCHQIPIFCSFRRLSFYFWGLLELHLHVFYILQIIYMHKQQHKNKKNVMIDSL